MIEIKLQNMLIIFFIIFMLFILALLILAAIYFIKKLHRTKSVTYADELQLSAIIDL